MNVRADISNISIAAAAAVKQGSLTAVAQTNVLALKRKLRALNFVRYKSFGSLQMDYCYSRYTLYKDG